MSIEFWLTFNNGEEKLRLPVNPPSITIESDHGFIDVQVSQLGEYTIIGERSLKGFSFSSFFPRYYHPSYCEYDGFPSPWEFVQTLERWRNTRRPMRLIVTKSPINIAVTMRSFTYDAERAGNIGDIFYDISFKEYRFINARKVEQTASSAKVKSASVRENTKATPTTVTVKKGDSLWKIAQKHLNNGSRWREIYELNKSVIGKNPDLIKPGQVLKLPK